MRLRNIPNADEIIKQSSYLIIKPEQYKGNFQKLFQNNNPIYVEIGMGKGNFIIQNAIQYPNINFIGIEKYATVLVSACEKLKQLKLPNLKIIKYDAMNINDLFDHEIDTVYLNFSDPWPKNRHENRRLTSIKFLEKYDSIFKLEKHIVMKTDNRKLFEFSILSFTNYQYQIKEISLDLYQDDIKDNIPTEYEMKFHAKGLPIYRIDVKK